MYIVDAQGEYIFHFKGSIVISAAFLESNFLFVCTLEPGYKLKEELIKDDEHAYLKPDVFMYIKIYYLPFSVHNWYAKIMAEILQYS